MLLKKLIRNKYTIILFFGIVFNIIGFFWYLLTIYNDSFIMYQKFNVFHTINDFEYQYWMHNYFNYFGGMWIVFSTSIIICLLLFLDFPSYKEIYNRLKKDFKEKIKKS